MSFSFSAIQGDVLITTHGRADDFDDQVLAALLIHEFDVTERDVEHVNDHTHRISVRTSLTPRQLEGVVKAAIAQAKQ